MMKDPRANPWSQLRDAIMIAVAIVVITYFHNYPLHLDFISHDNFHILLKRLYYIPILFSAYRFGIKGGLLASLSVSAFFVPHAIMSMGGLFESAALENLFDVLLYNMFALITGAIVEAKWRQAQRYEEVLKLNREIEDRETDIRHMKAYTESILSSVSSGVISCDRRGIIVTVNPEACKMLLRHEEDLVAFPLARIFEKHEELTRAAELVLAGEQKRATMETELESEGRPIPVAVRITPHRSRGQTVGIVITLEDLSEVKDLTEQLLRADKLSGLGELVAGVAHEVRNPLGVIKASVQMLEQEMDEGCQDAELTRVMAQEIERLDSVVSALLDFGRPSQSQFGPVDAHRVLGEVLLLTKQFARQQNVTVIDNSPDGLPDIRADEDRLKQIYVNLISNAIQAMPDGGSLTITAATREGFLRIAFTDTGIGISPEEKERIFDPFHTSRAEGTGLGLSIVHRIVDAHNGYITAESEPGAGSTFTVGLPLARRRALDGGETVSSAEPVETNLGTTDLESTEVDIDVS